MSGLIFSIVGARPQFIKAAPVSKALQQAGLREILLHTVQHYDYGLSQVFFEQLGMKTPDLNLEIGSGLHGWQTSKILEGVEKALLQERPDWVLVYGDTNSTLAGALAAIKLQIPIAHVEAGLRSFNREMPEEINRVLADHCANLLFCPTKTAVENLNAEGIRVGVHLVGDVMYDAVLQFAEIASLRSQILTQTGLKAGEYLLATIHRPYNTDDQTRLGAIMAALSGVNRKVVFPVHPRTLHKLEEFGLYPSDGTNRNLLLLEPVNYLDMLVLEQNAQIIITDSGGIQKEAYFFGVPCLTVRPETEWVETLQGGWNRLVDADPTSILNAIHNKMEYLPRMDHYGDGTASLKIANILQGT